MMATKKIEEPEHFCGFDEEWRGPCKTPVEPDGSRCDEHDLKCVSCGEPATHSCHETGQFVCGEPLCDGCQHLIWPEGHKPGIGFNAMDLPEGFTSRYIKKSERPDWM